MARCGSTAGSAPTARAASAGSTARSRRSAARAPGQVAWLSDRKLIDWQRDGTMRIYGWKRPNGTRRFRWVYCEVAKKCGKSPWTSGLACYHLVADDEGGPKIYLNACDRSQARIVFEHAANMVRQSADLAEAVEIIDSADRLVCRENFGAIIAN